MAGPGSSIFRTLKYVWGTQYSWVLHLATHLGKVFWFQVTIALKPQNPCCSSGWLTSSSQGHVLASYTFSLCWDPMIKFNSGPGTFREGWCRRERNRHLSIVVAVDLGTVVFLPVRWLCEACELIITFSVWVLRDLLNHVTQSSSVDPWAFPGDLVWLWPQRLSRRWNNCPYDKEGKCYSIRNRWQKGEGDCFLIYFIFFYYLILLFLSQIEWLGKAWEGR